MFGLPPFYVNSVTGLIHGASSVVYLVAFLLLVVEASLRVCTHSEVALDGYSCILSLSGIVSSLTAYFGLHIQSFGLSRTPKTTMSKANFRNFQSSRTFGMFLYSLMMLEITLLLSMQENDQQHQRMKNTILFASLINLGLIFRNLHRLWYNYVLPQSTEKEYRYTSSLWVYGGKHVFFILYLNCCSFNIVDTEHVKNVMELVRCECIVFGFFIEWGFLMYYFYSRKLLSIDMVRNCCKYMHFHGVLAWFVCKVYWWMLPLVLGFRPLEVMTIAPYFIAGKNYLKRIIAKRSLVPI